MESKKILKSKNTKEKDMQEAKFENSLKSCLYFNLSMSSVSKFFQQIFMYFPLFNIGVFFVVWLYNAN